MPTHHVLPESAGRLQEIADSLCKAKKVLVVTGAGISTNSGIPDFRSKNGLYSLIQAQFEAAAADKDSDLEDDAKDEPPAKRRRLSADDDNEQNRDGPAPAAPERVAARRTNRDIRRGRYAAGRQDAQSTESTDGCQEDTIHCALPDPLDDNGSIVVSLAPFDPAKLADSLQTPQQRGRFGSIQCLGSSSPLSSPPSALFDPAEEFRSGSTTSARSPSSNSSLAASTCSASDSDSDADADADGPPSSSQPLLSSQTSFASSRSTLPVMKGRDLFDASIWADPVKTSVFYTFATSLRQKVREVEPTRSHEFISHLRDSNKLVRCYTQNIDEIEEKVGLTTSLVLGPGKKGRFSTRSASRLSSMGVVGCKDGNAQGSQESQASQASQVSQQSRGSQDPSSSQEPISSQESSSSQEPQSGNDAAAQSGGKKATANRDPGFRGVECVFLHGSLRLLRCFRCGQTTPWDEDNREHETLSGRQPSCPRCAGATAAREGRGKRALAVGKLRPDIVLYGEEHPNAHLISPIVQHDISLAPDMLLILGTSLKVHGLKVLIREFSKAVHSRGGKVVFVNFTKPPESVWSDIIDYWVQWDCDAWVQDLKEKKPVMWLPPGSGAEEPKKRRKSAIGSATKGGGRRKSEGGGKAEDADETMQDEGAAEGPANGSGAAQSAEGDDGGKKAKRRQPKEPRVKKAKKQKDEAPTTASAEDAGEDAQTKEGELPAAQTLDSDTHQPPVELDDKANGACMVWKIRNELQQHTEAQADKEMPMPMPMPIAKLAGAKPPRGKRKPPRHSAPTPSELATLHSAAPPTEAGPTPLRTFHFVEPIVARVEPPRVAAAVQTPARRPPTPAALDKYSILSAVKANPRRRLSKQIFEGGGAQGPVMVPAQARTPKEQRPRQKAQPRGRSKSTGDSAAWAGPEPATPVSRGVVPAQEAAWASTDRLTEQLKQELFASQTSTPTVPAKTEREHAPSPGSIAPPQPRPLANVDVVLPPIQQLVPGLQPLVLPVNAFSLQDALGGHYGFPPLWPQERTCTDQLRQEADERLKAAVDRHGRRNV